MRKLLAASVILLLAGCASAPRPQVGIVSHPKVHRAESIPPAIATPLKTPRWYDRFRHSNGKFWH